VIPTALFLTYFPVKNLRMGPISSFDVSPIAIAVSLIIALLVGLGAGLWPAYQAMRLRTVDALRKVA
jgi:ABC-type antimicrobial peptide transport system permease subunit